MMNDSEKATIETLWVDDTPYATELTQKYKNRKSWTPPDNRKIIAFLPGTVTQVLVQKGEQVTEGQAVIKFEAMKMINTVQALVSKKIKEIHVKVGDSFPKGFLLVEFE